jgi:hypothetical protein
MVFAFNSFVVAATDRNIKTFGLEAFTWHLTDTSSKLICTAHLLLADLMGGCALDWALKSGFGGVDGGPLTLADINKFIEQNLIVSVQLDVLF